MTFTASDAGCPLPAAPIADFDARYDEIFPAGHTINPPVPRIRKRDRIWQRKTEKLRLCLRTYGDDAWRFASDHNVPFAKNFAEQAVRTNGMSLEETRSLLRMYEEGLSGYTYLERG